MSDDDLQNDFEKSNKKQLKRIRTSKINTNSKNSNNKHIRKISIYKTTKQRNNTNTKHSSKQQRKHSEK